MKLFTRFTMASEAAARWAEQYGGRRKSTAAIHRKLQALGPNPHPDDVDKAIGFSGWTTPPYCNECGASGVPTVQLGDEPDYDSSTACICGACLLKALQLVDSD